MQACWSESSLVSPVRVEFFFLGRGTGTYTYIKKTTSISIYIYIDGERASDIYKLNITFSFPFLEQLRLDPVFDGILSQATRYIS